MFAGQALSSAPLATAPSIVLLDGAALSSASATGRVGQTIALAAGVPDNQVNGLVLDGAVLGGGGLNIYSTSSATGSVSILTAVQASCAVSASATASLSHGVPLASQASAVCGATGDLALTVQLAASATASSNSSAGLQTTKPLAASAAGVSSVSGPLALTVPLAGAGTAAAVTTAAIAQTTKLSSVAAGVATSAGSVTVLKPLASTATAAATAASALQLSVILGGGGQASASTSAAVGLTKSLGGVSLWLAASNGVLTVNHLVPAESFGATYAETQVDAIFAAVEIAYPASAVDEARVYATVSVDGVALVSAAYPQIVIAVDPTLTSTANAPRVYVSGLAYQSLAVQAFANTIGATAEVVMPGATPALAQPRATVEVAQAFASVSWSPIYITVDSVDLEMFREAA